MSETNAVTELAPEAPGASGDDTRPAPQDQGGAQPGSLSRQADSAAQDDSIDGAYERALARLKAERPGDGGEEKISSEPGQAVSSQDGEDDSILGAENPSTSDAEATGDPPEREDDSSAEDKAPEDWDASLRKAYEDLPAQARAELKRVHNSLQAGFTKAMQRLAEERKNLPERTRELLEISARFERDPQETLTELAARKGLDLRFGPTQEEPPPEFESSEQLALWAAQRAEQNLERRLQQQEKAREAEQVVKQAEAELERELEQASRLPSWQQLQPAVLERLSKTPALSVQQAYDLEMVPKLRQLAEEGRLAKAELASLKKAQEKAKRDAFSPVGGVGSGREPKEYEGLSKTEIAMLRAERRLGRSAAG